MEFITPILDMESMEDVLKELTGQEVYEGLVELEDFFEMVDLKKNITITLEKVHIPSVGTVKDYEALVVSRFTLAEEDFCVIAADGYAINVSDLVRKAQDLIKDIP